jgi:hypothetical protein
MSTSSSPDDGSGSSEDDSRSSSCENRTLLSIAQRRWKQKKMQSDYPKASLHLRSERQHSRVCEDQISTSERRCKQFAVDQCTYLHQKFEGITWEEERHWWKEEMIEMKQKLARKREEDRRWKEEREMKLKFEWDQEKTRWLKEEREKLEEKKEKLEREQEETKQWKEQGEKLRVGKGTGGR